MVSADIRLPVSGAFAVRFWHAARVTNKPRAARRILISTSEFEARRWRSATGGRLTAGDESSVASAAPCRDGSHVITKANCLCGRSPSTCDVGPLEQVSHAAGQEVLEAGQERLTASFGWTQAMGSLAATEALKGLQMRSRRPYGGL